MRERIHTALKAALADIGVSAEFVVEHPADLAHGDYASNAALVASAHTKQNPRAFAEQLRERLDGAISGVARVEVAGPGFLNFTLSRQFFTEQLEAAQHAHWGAGSTHAGVRVMIEYTDPNPFKEFHVGHLFTSIVGESLSRLIEMTGAEVRRANYQGDVGMHVAHAIWGMQQLGITADTVDVRQLGKAYALGATAYKEQPEVAAEMKRINRAVYERSDAEITALYDAGRDASLAYFETIYAQLGTVFDHYFFERDAAPRAAALVREHPDVFPESSGARIFDGAAHGLHTRVFLNAEGLPTYEAKELALAQMKYEVYPYDVSIISTANEISEYFKVLKKAMGYIYPDLAAKTEHVGHGMVRLPDGKMSSRTGNVIPALDFIDALADAAAAHLNAGDASAARMRQVAFAAVKYAVLRSDITQDTVFDRERALSIEGDSGPYLQYTHARICSVLERARREGIAPDTQQAPELPYEVERLVYRFPDVVARAAAERAPHHVTTYLTQLAGMFNAFYAHEKIADADDVHAGYKAALAAAVQNTLARGLWCLGIEAPERM